MTYDIEEGFECNKLLMC